jgi:hypothetical protein
MQPHRMLTIALPIRLLVYRGFSHCDAYCFFGFKFSTARRSSWCLQPEEAALVSSRKPAFPTNCSLMKGDCL